MSLKYVLSLYLVRAAKLSEVQNHIFSHKIVRRVSTPGLRFPALRCSTVISSSAYILGHPISTSEIRRTNNCKRTRDDGIKGYAEGGELGAVNIKDGLPLVVIFISHRLICKFSAHKTTDQLPYLQSIPHPIKPILSSSTMKTFFLSLIFGLNAIISHAAPSPMQPEARQATTLSLDCTGATGSYQVEIDLPSQENFYNFNISESIPLPIATNLARPLPCVQCSMPTHCVSLSCRRF